MRTPLLVILATATLLATEMGCAAPTGVGRIPSARSPEEFVVYVFNKSGTQSVPVTIHVDGVCVENRIYAPFFGTHDYGEIRLRLPRGIHRVRAEVAGMTGQAEVDLEHHMSNVIYYDQTTDPKERGGVVPPKLTVEQIGAC